jgi:hypothetical protein
MTSVTTTTFSIINTGNDLSRLAPTTWEFVAPLLAFAIVMTMIGLVTVRHRRG